MNRRFRLAALPLALALALPAAAWSAALGRINVLSKVGEPLDAEIEVTSVRGDEAETLQAMIPSEEAYRDVGVTPSPRPESIRSRVERKPDGRLVVRLTSSEPVNRPLVDLLIVLSTKGQRFTRQYTFIVDPPDRPPTRIATPEVAPPPRAPAPPPVADRSPTPRPEPSRPPALAAPASAPAPAPQRASPAPDPGAKAYVVKSGDTLAKIARAHLASGLSIDQMMVAIYRANEDAFAGNINRLAAGARLEIPSPDRVASIGDDEAREVVQEQMAAFNAIRRGVATAVAALPPTPAPPPKPTPVATRPDPAPQKAPPRDRLTVSGAKDASNSLSDDLASRERALADAQRRIANLEQALEKLRAALRQRDEDAQRLAQPAPPGGDPANPR